MNKKAGLYIGAIALAAMALIATIIGPLQVIVGTAGWGWTWCGVAVIGWGIVWRAIGEAKIDAASPPAS